VDKISNEEVPQRVNETRTMLDTMRRRKGVVRACAKTWIITAWYNRGKNEGQRLHEVEKNAPAEWPDEKQKLNGSKAKSSSQGKLESWNIIHLLVAAED